MAGYNIMSDEEKQKYNYKRLCRVMGGCTGMIDLVLIIFCLTGEPVTKHAASIFCVIVIVVAVITVILANTICRNRSPK
ncbi:hypothetical protein I4300191C4_01810 [Solibaculum mannosilyticum]